MRIAVVGGTGVVGSHVVGAAAAGGHDVVALSRRSGVDVLTGEGLDDALRGADVVVDTTSIQSMSTTKAAAIHRTAAEHLLTAAARTGVGHAVLLSIVGVDRNPYNYYAGKLAQEAVFERSSVPHTILRATQFHEFAGQLLERLSVGPLHPVPRARIQPVAAREVGEHLALLAQQPPQGHALDLAGPREEELSDMARAYAAHVGLRGPVLPVRLPIAQLKGMREGLNLPTGDAVTGTQTFTDWLTTVPR